MLHIYVILACLLSATYARAVEHPKRHFRSAKTFGVNVNQRYMYMGPYDSLTVKCRVRISTKMPMDIPDIHFGIQYRHRTVVPLATGFPGVRISPSEHKSNGKSDHEHVVKFIRLGPPLYRFLNYGENVFFCRANSHTPEGRHQHGSSFFTINKI